MRLSRPDETDDSDARAHRQHTAFARALRLSNGLGKCSSTSTPDFRRVTSREALRAIETLKQVSYGLPPSQREQAPPTVLVKVVKHMATLAKGLQISQSIIGGIMVKVRSRQRYPGGANSNVVANSGKAAQSPSASIAPGPFVFIPPSTVA
jgi:hypothetical protein